MKKILRLCILLTSFNLLAAIPTVEGLFRNGNNPEVAGDFVVLKLMINEVDQRLEHRPDEENEDLKLSNIIRPRYLKLILSKQAKGRLQLLQVEYEDSKMEKDSILKSNYFPNLLEKIRTDTYVERSLFYSLWMMLGMNNPEGMNILFGRYGLQYQDNKSLINSEKVELMNKYKKYLTAIKNDSSLEGELISPLTPEDSEEAVIVKETIKSPFYKKDGKVKLVKDHSGLFWKADLESIHAFFSHEEHRLKNIELNTATGNTVFRTGQYILFDGIHELPKVAFMKDMLDRMFKIQVLSLSTFTNKGKRLNARAIEYNKLVRGREFGTRKMVEGQIEEKKIFLY